MPGRTTLQTRCARAFGMNRSLRGSIHTDWVNVLQPEKNEIFNIFLFARCLVNDDIVGKTTSRVCIWQRKILIGRFLLFCFHRALLSFSLHFSVELQEWQSI